MLRSGLIAQYKLWRWVDWECLHETQKILVVSNCLHEEGCLLRRKLIEKLYSFGWNRNICLKHVRCKVQGYIQTRMRYLKTFGNLVQKTGHGNFYEKEWMWTTKEEPWKRETWPEINVYFKWWTMVKVQAKISIQSPTYKQKHDSIIFVIVIQYCPVLANSIGTFL